MPIKHKEYIMKGSIMDVLQVPSLPKIPTAMNSLMQQKKPRSFAKLAISTLKC